MPTVSRRYLASSAPDSAVNSRPSTSMDPDVGRSRPPSRCNSVDFPEPDLPSNTSFWPRLTASETPPRARTTVGPVVHSLTTSVRRMATMSRLRLALSGDGGHGRLHLLRMAQILAADRLQVGVQFVDQR